MTVTNRVMVLFSLILLGFFARKFKFVSEKATKEFSSFVVGIALPAFIITSMNYEFSPTLLKNSMTLILISFSFYGLAMIIAKFFTKGNFVHQGEKDVFEYILVFPNTGFMGYPVLSVLFGDIGVFYGAIYNLAFSVLVWSYGVYLMTRGRGEKEALMQKVKTAINPGLIAVIVGFTMFLFSIRLPKMADEILVMVGRTTTPLSMMVIGFILTEIKIRELVDHVGIYLVSVMRLLILPLLLYGSLWLLGIRGYTLQIPVLLMAMPAAVNTAILAARYGNNYRVASKLIFMTTLFSMFTLPIIIKIIVA